LREQHRIDSVDNGLAGLRVGYNDRRSGATTGLDLH
jgi:hypothetical protein